MAYFFLYMLEALVVLALLDIAWDFLTYEFSDQAKKNRMEALQEQRHTEAAAAQERAALDELNKQGWNF